VQAVRWAGAAAGLLLVLATLNSVFRTLVVPRGFTSRLSIIVARVVKGTYRTAAGRLPHYEQRDALLASQAPATLLAQLLTWVALLITGFGLMMWPLRRGGLGSALRESGSSFLTLGFAATDRPVSTFLNFAAATFGLVVVALQVGYLPTIYSAFNRRETLVTRLQSRAGEPAWGPEILARHALVGTVDNLPLLYDDWETWAADVAESHSNYPALVYFRSPQPLRSWIVGLLAVLDSAALYLACCPSTAPSEARLALRMGFTCLRDIATTLGMTFDPDPRPDAPIELTYDEFLAGIARMSAGGFQLERSAEEAWPHFRGWRVNYEQLAYELADRVDAVPAPWSGPRRGEQAPIAIRRPVNRVPEAPDEDYSLPQIGDRQRRSLRATRRR
jgi:hypothetical protein